MRGTRCRRRRFHHETDLVVVDDEYIRRTASAHRTYAVVTLSDSGSGMSETTRRRIFEPFFHDQGTGQRARGSPLDHLRIVQQHDGFIHVYSEPGQGTNFKV